MRKIWLVIRNNKTKLTYTKYFDTEFEKDKYKRRVHHIQYLMIIEDSTDIYFND